jgi:hypothetical protein
MKRRGGNNYPRLQPYRAVSNWRNISRKVMAGAFFRQPVAAMHSPRKNLLLPQQKLRASSLPQDRSSSYCSARLVLANSL